MVRPQVPEDALLVVFPQVVVPEQQAFEAQQQVARMPVGAKAEYQGRLRLVLERGRQERQYEVRRLRPDAQVYRDPRQDARPEHRQAFSLLPRAPVHSAHRVRWQAPERDSAGLPAVQRVCPLRQLSARHPQQVSHSPEQDAELCLRSLVIEEAVHLTEQSSAE